MIRDHNILISVIMPVHNRESSVLKSIQSVLSQTYSNFEFIIVDDCSQDASAEIIKSISDDRIKLVFLERNVGAAKARNIGLESAKGEWIAFQDSDDLWESNKLEKQVEMIDVQSPSIIFTSFIRYKGSKQEYIPNSKTKMMTKGSPHKALLKGNFIATPTVLIPKSYFELSGNFNEKMPRFQDWELWLRLSQHYSFTWIDEALVKVNFTEGSISSDSDKLLKGYELIWKLHHKMFIDAGSEYASRFLFSYGHNLSLYGQIKKGRKVLVKSIKYKVFSIRQLICLCLNLFGNRLYRFVYGLFK